MRRRFHSAKLQAWADILAWDKEAAQRSSGRITLAGRPKGKVFRREKRRHMVKQVMDVLRDWRATPFENEAATIYGLRSGMCLDGHGWQKADDEARELVAEALRLLGAERPTWEQGQREYSVPDDYCNWCHSPLPVDGSRVRFCSTDCAKAAIQWRDYETTYKNSIVGNAAYYLIRKSQQPVRPCKHCGIPFHTETKDSVFCSIRCAGLHKRIPQKPCKSCGTLFTPHKSNAGLFCSQACAARNGRRAQYPKICEWCYEPFMAKMQRATACSRTCGSYLARKRTGQMPMTVTPLIFDHYVRPGQPRLSPSAFDYVFRMAA